MKTVIIAEIGVNHNGSVEIAKKLIKKQQRLELNLLNFKYLIQTN